MTRRLVAVLFTSSLLCLDAAEQSDAETPLPPTAAANPYLNFPKSDRGRVPELLSQTGAFSDTLMFSPVAALLRYDVNVSFWSDGAEKSRWIALPRGAAPIEFSSRGSWRFPAGTVFVKHFEFKNGDNKPVRRLETRFLVINESGGLYGASYKWRADGAEADLVREGHREMVPDSTPGSISPRPWYFPGPEDCRKCHLAVAGGVLGVNTRQLNRRRGGASESSSNQLLAWSRLRLFDIALLEADISELTRLAAPDRQNADLAEKARSFLDVNCGYCHRPGGAVADFDARYETPLLRQGLINAPARINLGIDNARQIAPNDPWRSLVLVRMRTIDDAKMPPLAHEVCDPQGIQIVEQWISSLPGKPVVAPPTIQPVGGDFPEAVQVTITHNDPFAVVRYTMDGSPAGADAMIYQSPLHLGRSATVRARAFKQGCVPSIGVYDTFIISD